MNELRRLDGPVTASVFDEAREAIARWEKAFPDTQHVLLVLDRPTEMEAAIAGGKMRPSEIAGLFFAAAQGAVE